jgi:hypothetical protein
MVALDETKMRPVANPKNIAGAERLARDTAHTEREIAYYLDPLDVAYSTSVVICTIGRGHSETKNETCIPFGARQMDASWQSHPRAG